MPAGPCELPDASSPGVGEPFQEVRGATIGGSDLMPFDNLHLVTLPAGDAAIVQIDPEYAIHSADRGTPLLELPDPAGLGMRGGIRLDRAIVGFSFKADTDLAPVLNPSARSDCSTPVVCGWRRSGADPKRRSPGRSAT